MELELSQLWSKMQTDFSSGSAIEAVSLFGYLILGGLCSIYFRFLYHRFSVSASNSDSVTRVFPLLTMVTIGVIAVVKSSLALSLGLVGALSIVRFRAAIKEPEELVYLFLCIGTGLCLGAGNPILALVIVIASSLFVILGSFGSMTKTNKQWLVTISGDEDSPLNNTQHAIDVLQSVVGSHDIQRFDSSPGHHELRVLLSSSKEKSVSQQIQVLKEKLPGCELSYFNLSSSV